MSFGDHIVFGLKQGVGSKSLGRKNLHQKLCACSKCNGLYCNNTAPTLIEADDDDNVDISTVNTASDDENDD